VAGQAYCYILRSPIAHATINAIDTANAASAEGVISIMTGADFAEVGGLPCGWAVTSIDGSPMHEPKHPVLADGKVRHVGDPIAAVIAETYAQARDAAELIEVDITELPAVVDAKSAATSSTKVHDDIPSNVCFDWGFVQENKEAVDAAIASAHRGQPNGASRCDW